MNNSQAHHQVANMQYPNNMQNSNNMQYLNNAQNWCIPLGASDLAAQLNLNQDGLTSTGQLSYLYQPSSFNDTTMLGKGKEPMPSWNLPTGFNLPDDIQNIRNTVNMKVSQLFGQNPVTPLEWYASEASRMGSSQSTSQYYFTESNEPDLGEATGGSIDMNTLFDYPEAQQEWEPDMQMMASMAEHQQEQSKYTNTIFGDIEVQQDYATQMEDAAQMFQPYMETSALAQEPQSTEGFSNYDPNSDFFDFDAYCGD